MRNERKKQVITLSILVAAILITSIGFAAFSSTLRIKTKTTVTPNSSDFKVVFSSSENSLETNPITPNQEGMGSNGEIDNTTTPTISGLTANFTNPGDEVTYTFYVRNEGKYEAFLNSISFRGKNCIAGEGASESMVINACNSIITTVSVGNIKTSATKTNITRETLTPGQSKQVTVTISYDLNGTRVDGPFRVEFGDISMYYDAVSGINEEVENGTLYTGLIYRNSTQDVYIGDSIDKISTYETNLSNISQNHYLKHEVVDDIVTASYACITYTENGTRKDVCLSGVDTTYLSNQAILRRVESYFNTLPSGSETGSCIFDASSSGCDSDYLSLYVDSDGYVLAGGGSSFCYIDYGGNSCCDW